MGFQAAIKEQMVVQTKGNKEQEKPTLLGLFSSLLRTKSFHQLNVSVSIVLFLINRIILCQFQYWLCYNGPFLFFIFTHLFLIQSLSSHSVILRSLILRLRIRKTPNLNLPLSLALFNPLIMTSLVSNCLDWKNCLGLLDEWTVVLPKMYCVICVVNSPRWTMVSANLPLLYFLLNCES